MVMLTTIVVLHLLVHDTETGALLYEGTRTMPSFANSIEDCRKMGVEKALRLTAEYRKTHPAAFANVDCAWWPGVLTDPA
jgi:hypothetical protein